MDKLKLFFEGENCGPVADLLNRYFEVEFDKNALLCVEEGILKWKEDKRSTFFDWVKDFQLVSRQKRNPKDLLFKAVSGKKHKVNTVLDATLGTGKDAMLLLSYGLRVKAVERHPEVFALCLDAWRRLIDAFPELKDRFEIFYADSLELKDSFYQGVDLIYFDPMFPKPERKKTALPRKEMNFFRGLVGKDEDSDQFLEKFSRSEVKKILVKRHPKSPYLSGRKPSQSYEGKTVRYDLYLNN